mmetsp:Transcript_105575/g.191988  ORF Transcript_105575/g.191988 Transcript_105575/m.191988 type:complete len:660 (+) Transcript_105575:64-2043(+)
MLASSSGPVAVEEPSTLADEAAATYNEGQPTAQFVWILEYKGNYKDICGKLGQELYEDVVKVRTVRGLLDTPKLPEQMRTPEGQHLMREVIAQLGEFEAKSTLSPSQHELRRICEKMGYREHTCRPEWASPAHVFVNEVVAPMLEDTFEAGELRKEHIIVSPEFRYIVEDVMSQGIKKPKLQGESAKSIQKGEISMNVKVETSMSARTHDLLKELPEAIDKIAEDGIFVQAKLLKVGPCSSLASRRTHTTGEHPRRLADAVKTWQRRRKHFTLWGQSKDLQIFMSASCSSAWQGGHDDSHGEREEGHDDTNDCDNDHSEDEGGSHSRTSPQWVLLVAALMDARHMSMLESTAKEEYNSEMDPIEYQTTRSIVSLNDDSPKEELDIAALEELITSELATYEPSIVKSEHQFATLVDKRVSDFNAKVAMQFVNEYQVEFVLASGPEDGKRVMKKAMKSLTEAATRCWDSDYLHQFLVGHGSVKPVSGADTNKSLEGWRRAFSETAPLVAKDVTADLSKRIVSLVKGKTRSSSDDWKRLTAMQSEGPHAIADELKDIVQTAMNKALSEMDVSASARQRWQQQEKEHKQVMKTSKSTSSRLGPGTRLGDAVDHQGVHGGVGVALAGQVSTEYLMRKVPFKHSAKPGKHALVKAKESKRVMFNF